VGLNLAEVAEEEQEEGESQGLWNWNAGKLCGIG